MRSALSARLVLLLASTLVHAAGCGDDTSTPEECVSLGTVLESYDVRANVTVPEGCYLVEENLYVSSGAVLTLSPGVTFRVAKEVGLEIEADGALRAEGTSAKPILLTGQEATPGFWNGVTLANSASDDNVFDHVTIEHGGAKELQDDAAEPFRAALALVSSGFEVRARIRNTTIRESSGYGFFFAATAVVPEFVANTATANAAAGYVYSTSAHYLGSDSSYAGNTTDWVHVNAGGEFGEEPRAWAALDVPYHVDGVFVITTSLTLAPGTRLLFSSESGIRVLDELGALVAEGTSAAPITFSGEQATPGFWNGLFFANTDDVADPRSRLSHVVIEHGGAFTFQDSNAEDVNGNLLLDSSGWPVAVSISDSTIRQSSGYGVWLDCLATLTEQGLTFEGNARGDRGLEQNCD